MRCAAPLSDRAFEHRLRAVVAILRGIAEVGSVSDGRDAHARRLVIRAAAPGYELPLEATVLLVERWARARHGWEMAAYRYDYHREPKPSGRKAHHWHDGSHHIHCVDPMRPGAVHYRGFPVDALEVVREFREIHAAGRVSCSGLYSLLR